MKKTAIIVAAAFLVACIPASAKVYINKGQDLFSIDVKHNGKTVEIMRNQDKNNQISERYRPTHRGAVQPMNPFAPHQVETIGELEMLDYLKRSQKDDSIVVIDSRTPDWNKKGTIPGSINVPFTDLKGDAAKAVEFMEKMGVKEAAMLWDFSDAKTLVMFCNGAWCGQSPTAIKTLLKFGYPAAKIKYFRGGMQSWESLGLTVIQP